jgi:hypothetical protein
LDGHGSQFELDFLDYIKGKQALVTKKDHGLPYEINKTNVLKLIKDAWTNSFGHTKTNRQGLVEDGVQGH